MNRPECLGRRAGVISMGGAPKGVGAWVYACRMSGAPCRQTVCRRLSCTARIFSLAGPRASAVPGNTCLPLVRSNGAQDPVTRMARRCPGHGLCTGPIRAPDDGGRKQLSVQGAGGLAFISYRPQNTPSRFSAGMDLPVLVVLGRTRIFLRARTRSADTNADTCRLPRVFQRIRPSGRYRKAHLLRGSRGC